PQASLAGHADVAHPLRLAARRDDVSLAPVLERIHRRAPPLPALPAPDLEHAGAGEAHPEASESRDGWVEQVLREPSRALVVIGHGSDVDTPRAEGLGELAMCGPGSDEDRARPIESVRSRECKGQPGQRRPAPASRRSGAVWAQGTLHAT